MSSSSLSRVNQKLAYCRAMVRLSRADDHGGRADRRLQRQALLDAGAFHLLCAYRHYLRELAETYRLPDSASVLTEQDLITGLERLGRNPAEALELQALHADSDSWLAALQQAYNACWERGETPSGERIEVVDLGSPGGPAGAVTGERLEHWLSAFEQLVERQRETSAEY